MDSGETNLRQGSLKRHVFAVIGTIITKRSSVAFVAIIFFVVGVGCASATLYNLIAMWPLGLDFMLTS